MLLLVFFVGPGVVVGVSVGDGVREAPFNEAPPLFGHWPFGGGS